MGKMEGDELEDCKAMVSAAIAKADEDFMECKAIVSPAAIAQAEDGHA
jgi:hypothetical protein